MYTWCSHKNYSSTKTSREFPSMVLPRRSIIEYNGFTLLEALVVVTIIAITGSIALPSYHRAVLQGNIDRYAKFVESGLFDLKARLGTTRSSCSINLDETYTVANDEFGKPWQVLEFQGEDEDGEATRFENADEERLLCCEDSDGDPAVCTEDQLAEGEVPYRFINLEGSKESKKVELSASQATYDLSPPGTSVSGDDLTILIRAVDFDDLSEDLQDSLFTRCVSLMGNGLVQSGTWVNNSCESR